MNSELSSSAQRMQNVFSSQGLSLRVVELPDSTRTAVEAAQAIDCQVGQIVKSLIFKGKRSRRPILVLASGLNRVDERKVEALIGEPLGRADAEFVHRETGFSIGGVAPVGHIQALETFIDEDLLNYDYLWAAAGTPHAVFRIDPALLVKISAGKTADIKSA